MNKLIIVGAGGLGRETLQWALQSTGLKKEWDVVGFIDDNLKALEALDYSYPILGTIRGWEPKSDERFVISIGSPKIKKGIAEELLKKGAVFTSIIHRTVTIAATSKLGRGIILCPNAVLSDSCKIGDHAAINISTSIGHDAVVGTYATLSSFCDITGGVSLGEGVFFGSSVSIIPQRKVGAYAFVCAGSCVMNNIPPETTVMGVPAKKFSIQGS